MKITEEVIKSSGSENNSLWKDIKRKGYITVGTPGDYFPFSYREDEKFSGIDIDIMREFAIFAGVEAVFTSTSWGSLMDDLYNRRFDMAVGGIGITKERRRKALFSATYFRTGKAPLALRKNAHLFGSLSEIDMPGVKVIVNPGGTNEAFARKKLKKASLIVHSDNITVFDRILRGHADLMITDAIEAMIWEKRCPDLKAVNPRRPFTCSKFAFIFGPRELVFKEVLDNWLVEYATRGGIRNALFNWTGKKYL